MRCFCCEQNDFTHLVTTDQGEQVPYCDECDGELQALTDNTTTNKGDNMGKLSDSTKNEIVEFLFDCMRHGMFGDGMEDDYIRNGMSFKGLNNYTDEELVSEILRYTGEDEELYQTAKLELSVEGEI
jgi:hypothetical protein